MSTVPLTQYLTFKKLRLYVAWPAACVALWLARPTTESILRGLPLVAAGMALRWWAAGSVRKSRQLAIGGPYAHLRNPLYAGSFLMLLGFCAMLDHSLLWAVLPAGFAWLYWGTVRKEEQELAQKFGDRYRSYARAVPRFLPRWQPYRGGDATDFDWRHAYANGESITSWAAVLAILCLYFYRAFLLDQSEVNGLRAFWLLIAAAVAAELALEVLERRRKDRPEHVSIGTALFQRRAWLPVPLIVGGVLVLLLAGNPLPWGAPERIAADVSGLLCLATAEGLRIWGVGHCGRKTRSASIHASRLVTSGPYAHVRHPLYVSNLLITLGIACLTGAWWTLLACALYWVVVYRRIIAAEEAFLHATFGAAFESYRRKVPRLLPRLTPARLPPSSTFRRAELRKEYQTVIAITVSILCVEATLAAHGWLPKVSRVWLHRLQSRSSFQAPLDHAAGQGYLKHNTGEQRHA